MTLKMINSAYGLNDAKQTKEFYDTWAKSYDEEITENGYATPRRCADALAQFAKDKTAPLLDIGCGTGVSGKALAAAGFTTIDGCDFSAEMLKHATDKRVYRNLANTDLNNPFPFAKGQYSNISAIGVLNPGHAPASTLDVVLGLLKPGGLFVFSLNDHALADHSYDARINDHVDCGNALLLFRKYGPHLPAIDLKSNVYVLQKQ